VLSTLLLDFTPLTAIMIVMLAVLDDGPIMTIAYDNTEVAPQPIRWRMPRVLGVSSALGFFSVVQSFGLLLIGFEILSSVNEKTLFQLYSADELQSVMFLQIVLGGHFLLYNTRTARWFFLPPFPSFPLNVALWVTNILAILMCAYGWLVPKLSWVFIMDLIKVATYTVAERGAGWQTKHRRLVEQPLGSSDTTVPAVRAAVSAR
jgi:H+-transporting ATPase